MRNFLGYLLLIPAAVGNALLRGWVFTVLWGWFVVSQFHLPQIGILESLGLVVLSGLLVSKTLTDKETLELLNQDKRKEMSVGLAGRWIQTLVYAVVTLIFLFSGWIYHSFM